MVECARAWALLDGYRDLLHCGSSVVGFHILHSDRAGLYSNCGRLLDLWFDRNRDGSFLELRCLGRGGVLSRLSKQNNNEKIPFPRTADGGVCRAMPGSGTLHGILCSYRSRLFWSTGLPCAELLRL